MYIQSGHCKRRSMLGNLEETSPERNGLQGGKGGQQMRALKQGFKKWKTSEETLEREMEGRSTCKGRPEWGKRITEAGEPGGGGRN